MPKIVDKIRSILSKHQLKLYQSKKKAHQDKHSPFWNHIKIDIGHQLSNFNSLLKAIAEHDSKLLQTLEQTDDYKKLCASCNNLRKLLKQLDNIKDFADKQHVSSDQEIQAYKERLKQETSNLKINSAETFKRINKEMSALLHCFAKVLLESIEKNESSRAIRGIKLAALIDDANLIANRSGSTELIALGELNATLSSLVNSENLSSAFKTQLSTIHEVLKENSTSSENIKKFIIFSFNEIQIAQRNAVNRIISEGLSPAECIDKLFEELNYEFYLPEFQAILNTFIHIDNVNQKLLYDIKEHLKLPETLTKYLKPLSDKYQKKLDHLLSKADTETLDGNSKLSEELTTLANVLVGVDYFEAVKNELLSFLTKMQTKVTSRLNEDEIFIQTIQQTLANGDEQTIPLVEDYKNKRLEISSLIANRINNCKQLTELEGIKKFAPVDYKKISCIYNPIRTEIAEYRIALQVLKQAKQLKTKYVDVAHILAPASCPYTQRESEFIKSSSNKLFLLLGKANNGHLGNYLENLFQFLAEQEETQNNPNLEDKALLRLRTQFKLSIREGLPRFINEEQADKICNYLYINLGKENYEQFYRLLDFLTLDTLNEQLKKCVTNYNKYKAIQRMIVTKKLLHLFTSSDSTVCQSKFLFKDVYRLFDTFSTEEQVKPLLVTSQAKDWFNDVKRAIEEFKNCSFKLDNKKNNYLSTFFLTGDDSKQGPIEELKNRLVNLPFNAKPEEFNNTVKNWETEFGPTINKTRYQPLLKELMEVFHRIQTFFTGKAFECKTRRLVNELQQSARAVITSATSS